jgi:hypothetical protein
VSTEVLLVLAVAVVRYMAGLESLFFAVTLVNCDYAREAIAAAVETAAAEADVSGPCSAEPIPSWHWASSLLPFQRKP